MSLEKDPSEIITVTFDFSALATSCSNPVVTCHQLSGTVDSTVSSMISGSAQLSGTSILQRIHGGIDGAAYKLRCQIDDADGERFVLADTLTVTAF